MSSVFSNIPKAISQFSASRPSSRPAAQTSLPTGRNAELSIFSNAPARPRSMASALPRMTQARSTHMVLVDLVIDMSSSCQPYEKIIIAGINSVFAESHAVASNNVRIGITGFSGRAWDVAPFAPVDAQPSLSFNWGDQTAIGTAIKHSHSKSVQCKRDSQDQGLKPVLLMFLMTDGASNTGEDEIAAAAAAKANGIVIVGLAVGDEADWEKIKRISSQGMAFYADDASALFEVMNQFGKSVSRLSQQANRPFAM